MKLDFPLLTKDDIEIRIGQMSKDGTKASLLLYQDARCGMKYLDQVVGPMNWQKKFYEVRGLVICSLGIYDKDTNTWTWKDDTGTSGTIEEEKSIISDSFKRCCVCFGLARELYTAPTIWVKISSKYDKFFVKEIGYHNREINKLVITNENGEVVYSYGSSEKVAQTSEKPPKSTNGSGKGTIRPSEKAKIGAFLESLDVDKANKFYNWLDKNFHTMNYEMLSDEEGLIVCTRWNLI